MKGITSIVAGFAAALGAGAAAHAEDITIATVNNGDMIIMQKLSPKWEQQTGNKINWVILEENVLRQRVTTDIATKGGQYDVVTIGAYETPIWGKAGWLDALDDFKDYDYDDLLPPVKASLSYGGKLFAAPFYAESSFTMYRKDLFEKAGLTMPEQPTYEQLRTFADKLNDKAGGVYGICLRGKPGWGENMAFVGPMVNSFGGQWFSMSWKPELDSQAWQKAISYYVDLMKADGPPGATANGFNENQALFSTGKCAIWIDANLCRRPDLRSQAEPGGRQDRLHQGTGGGDAERVELDVGLGAGDPDLVQEGGRRKGFHALGDLQGLREARRRVGGLGGGASRHPQVDL